MNGSLLRRPRALLWAETSLILVAVALMIPDPGAIGLAIVGIPVLVYGWLGARIAERAPENRIGWLLSACATTAALGLVASAYTQLGTVHGNGAPPLTSVVRLLTAALPVPIVLVCFLLVILSYPTGRLPSVRWRPATWLVVVVGILVGIAFLRDPALYASGRAPAWLRNLPFWESLPDLTIVLGAVAFLVTVASLFVRSRSVAPEERREIRGLLVTLLVMAAAIPPFAYLARNDENWIFSFFLGLALALGCLVVIPFSLSVAMLRYGLFDYEVGIRKTIARRVLVAVVVLLAGALFLLVAAALLGSFLSGTTAATRQDPVTTMAIGVVLGILLMLVIRWARRFADRVVFRERETPYEILSTFSGRVGETYSLDDVLPRMAVLLARGTGAAAARVWLQVDGELRPIASYPDDAPHAEPIMAAGEELTASDPLTHPFPVRHQGELLGALVVTMPKNDPMNPQKEQLVRDVAGQAGLLLRNVGLLEDVRESRRRIVAAQDERARALERNIHDGAQQQLVALTVKLRLAEELVARDPEKLREMLAALQTEATDALEDLRDLARGIYPPVLADKGLAPALEAQARKSPVPVSVVSDGLGRYSQDIESAVYFSCLEALQNVAKYAQASSVKIALARVDGRLTFTVDDDGIGFDTVMAPRGTGLQGIADRLDALGGTFGVVSTLGEGTVLAGSVPVD
jgi:signal transduction histidine kinase